MVYMTAATIANAITHSNIPNFFRIILRYWSCDASLAQSRDAIQGCLDVWSRRDGYATAIVTVGVILECFEVTYALKWYVRKKIGRTFMRAATRQKDEPEWFAVAGAVGLLLVILGVSGEWVFEGRVSEAGRSLSNFDHNQTLIAEQHAGDAKHSAEGAKTLADAAGIAAKGAEKIATTAEGDSRKATLASSSALNLAGETRKEADSVEKDIASAKFELARMKADRYLFIPPEMEMLLERRKGTEYAFSGVFLNSESIELLKMIDVALNKAGWKRVDLPRSSGAEVITIPSRGEEFSIVVIADTGIHVSVESLIRATALMGMSDRSLPPIVYSGVFLHNLFDSCISPRPDKSPLLDVKPGTSMIVSIAVGSKP
jgi:hypothetical protein